MQRLEASEKALRKIFCAEYDFLIPDYQRPYAWGTEQAGELFDDLSSALDRGEGEPYFLGSIVLIKQPDVPRAEVVDGQQRLTTLTILFAVFADMAADQATARELRERADRQQRQLVSDHCLHRNARRRHPGQAQRDAWPRYR